jgi:Sec-independent protein translocase protein TatA
MGFGEITIILFLCLFFLKPDDIEKLTRCFVKFITNINKYIDNIKKEFNNLI